MEMPIFAEAHAVGTEACLQGFHGHLGKLFKLDHDDRATFGEVVEGAAGLELAMGHDGGVGAQFLDIGQLMG